MKTPARSVTPIVAEADLVASATLVAVIVNDPALAEKKMADVVVGVPLKLPPDAVQLTPALPISFVTVAVNPSVWDSVRPPRLGVIATLMLFGAGVRAVAVLE